MGQENPDDDKMVKILKESEKRRNAFFGGGKNISKLLSI